MSNSIKGAIVFRSGTWNGQTFTDADLQDIARSFTEANLAGRVPLKFGHDDDQPLTDGQPALGWVSKVWAVGGNLYADFTDIPSQVYSFIKKGLYKFTSIELLQDARLGDRQFPYLLDAVALLGAEPPAVSGLSDLQKLAATRRDSAAVFDTRLAFRWEPRDRMGDAEADRLRAENEALKAQLSKSETETKAQRIRMHREAVTRVLEAGVRGRKIIPAVREQFTRVFKVDDDDAVLNVNLGDVELLVGLRMQDAEKILAQSRSAFTRNPRASGDAMEGGVEDFETFNQEIVKLSRQYADEHKCTTFEALPHVLRLNPELQQPFLDHIFD